MERIELLLKVRKMKQMEEFYFKNKIKVTEMRLLSEVEVGYIAV